MANPHASHFCGVEPRAFRFRSIVIRKSGCSRGLRLIDLESLNAFLEREAEASIRLSKVQTLARKRRLGWRLAATIKVIQGNEEMKSATEKPPGPGNEKAALAGGDLKANQYHEKVHRIWENSSGNVLLNWPLTRSWRLSLGILI